MPYPILHYIYGVWVTSMSYGFSEGWRPLCLTYGSGLKASADTNLSEFHQGLFLDVFLYAT